MQAVSDLTKQISPTTVANEDITDAIDISMKGVIELTNDILILDDLATQVANASQAIGEVGTIKAFGEI